MTECISGTGNARIFVIVVEEYILFVRKFQAFEIYFHNFGL